MKSRRGKHIAWRLTAVGLLVLVACAVAFKDRAVEQYWLWKLESEDVEEQKLAAERLAELGSVRAMPVMLKKLRETDTKELVWLLPAPGEVEYAVLGDVDGNGFNDLVVAERGGGPILGFPVLTSDTNAPLLFLLKALWKIADTTRRECIPCLVAALSDDDPHIRYLATTFLGTIGPDASSAVPALVRALEAPTPGSSPAADLRAQAAWALGQIGPGADGAIPALTAALQDGDEAVRRAAAEALKRMGTAIR